MAKHYQIQKFAQLAGVTVKALPHYDRLGLLTPRLLPPGTGPIEKRIFGESRGWSAGGGRIGLGLTEQTGNIWTMTRSSAR